MTLYAQWQINDVTPPGVTLSRKTYNTFTWSATDNYALAGYKISQESTVPTSGWTTIAGTSPSGTSTSITTKGTWYIWVKDGAGLTASSTINAYTLTRSVGTNTTLVTKVDTNDGTTAASPATSVTRITNSTTAVLEGTPVYTSATTSASGYIATLQKETIVDDSRIISATDTTSRVGCYADIDGDLVADGIIYADLAIGSSGEKHFGREGDGTYTVPTSSNFNEYIVINESYNGNDESGYGFGTQPF